MFRDGIFHHLTLVGNGIKLNLLGILHELRHHYGEFLRHLGSHIQEAVQLLIIIANVHGST